MRKRFITIFILLLLVVGVAVSLQVTKKKPNVNLVLSPTKAAAQLDSGKHVKNGSFYVTPGQHTVTASFSGFATKKVSFTAKGSGIQIVTLLLVPNSTEGYTYLQNHPDEATKRESIGSSQFYTDSQQRTNSNPIIKLLPYIGPGNSYRIDYGDPPASTEGDTTDSNDIGIYITYYTASGIQDALGWIKDQGYNPDLLHITYTDKTDEQQPTNNPNTN